MKRTQIFVFLFFLVSCSPNGVQTYQDYPDSKIWAHKANDTLIAQQKELLFDGLEVDVQYSAFQDEFFIGHELEDTNNGVTLARWFSSLKHVSEKWFWIDMKNLDESNALQIANKIIQLKQTFGISHLMLESRDWKALKIVKETNIPVIFLVSDNFWYWKEFDTVGWYNLVRKKVNYLHPDALSCEYRMFPLLPDSFPEYPIHFWHTQVVDSVPIDYTPENVEFTRKLCNHKSVKVVLVDYGEPISY